jgi:Cellulase (glycosyl hydrolase family 5)
MSSMRRAVAAAVLFTLLSAVPAAAITTKGPTLRQHGKVFQARGYSMIGVLAAGCPGSSGPFSRARKRVDDNIRLAKEWGSNTIRFQVSQNGLAGPDWQRYRRFIVHAVGVARRNDLAVILSMQDHRPDKCAGHHLFPTQRTKLAWTRLAPRFRGDAGIMYELFNEPSQVIRTEFLSNPARALATSSTTCIPQRTRFEMRRKKTQRPTIHRAMAWHIWRYGGTSPLMRKYGLPPAVGHQALADLVRKMAPHTVLIVDGMSWSFNWKGATGPLRGSGIAYAWHPYYYRTCGWRERAGFIVTSWHKPLVVTEWGPSGIYPWTNATKRTATTLRAWLTVRDSGVLFNALDAGLLTWAFGKPTGTTAHPGPGLWVKSWLAYRAKHNP